MVDVIANFIAAIGVLVTGIFSCLVYRATSATAKVAEETLNLNKRLIEEEKRRTEEQKKIMRMHLSRVILDETRKVENALASIDEMIIYRNLYKVPAHLSVQTKELAEYFSSEEISIIRKAWDSYEQYRNDYFQDVYQGNGMKVLVENASPVLMELNNVVNILANFKE